MILIFSLTIITNRNHPFAKQTKTFLRNIKRGTQIPPKVAANPRATVIAFYARRFSHQRKSNSKHYIR